MDILLMGMTTLKNGFVYCQFHPVVYMVKLAIEMSMSRLLIKVARSTGINVYEGDKWTSDTKGVATTGTISVRVQNHVITDRDNIGSETEPRDHAYNAQDGRYCVYYIPGSVDDEGAGGLSWKDRARKLGVGSDWDR
ncbi:hypothetical protein PQX77_010682 [Marasmius sp. AFHP31]|nr:hypothetical protein PQX77_010682 [Marasmius sp. AFHP31]